MILFCIGAGTLGIVWQARFILLPSKKGKMKKNQVECVQL